MDSERTTYLVEITSHARRQLARLPNDVLPRIRAAIDGLAQDPRPHGSRKLTGLDQWRIRVGDYRVIYEIRDAILTVVVVEVIARKNAYRRRR